MKSGISFFKKGHPDLEVLRKKTGFLIEILFGKPMEIKSIQPVGFLKLGTRTRFACCMFWFIFFLFVNRMSAQQNYLIILGVAQDAGYPHIGCMRSCCAHAWKSSTEPVYVCSFACVDSLNRKWWLFEASPDIGKQLDFFNTLTSGNYPYLPEGIVISHAHIGHYSGLMYLGKEALHTSGVKVYVMPRMKKFLEANGPWSQLVDLGNIDLVEIHEGQMTDLSAGLSMESFSVPHRDEFSETAGFRIHLESRNILFIPDINKWSSWNKSILDELKKVDLAFIDGTFFSSSELPYRKMEDIPHPLVEETMDLFKDASEMTRNKIHFIHFNHTNPLIWSETARAEIFRKGFSIARQGARY